MASILEFEEMQDKLDIQWEVISNSTSEESLYPPLNLNEDPLLMHQLSEQAFHHSDLAPSPSTISNLSQATITATTLSNRDPSILNNAIENDEIEIEDGFGLDFFFDINNPAFLHSFVFTLLFFFTSCLIMTSMIYLSQRPKPAASFTLASSDHPNYQYHQSQSSEAFKKFSFEFAGQMAGKALDGVLGYFTHCVRNLSTSVEAGELQEKMSAWRDEGFEALKKVSTCFCTVLYSYEITSENSLLSQSLLSSTLIFICQLILVECISLYCG